VSGLVLIVDDEPDVLLLLRLTLEARGWAVEEAADGHEALARCRRQPSPTAVVLDQRMPPGPSGLEVAAILRDEGFTAPIALHSAYFPAQVAEQAEAAGLSLIAKGNLEHLAEVLPKLVNDR
jgi:CheY-like chemotaxis protein